MEKSRTELIEGLMADRGRAEWYTKLRVMNGLVNEERRAKLNENGKVEWKRQET